MPETASPPSAPMSILAKIAILKLKKCQVNIVKVFGMVNSTPDFVEQPTVINGVSDLLIEVFGQERGCHARSAVGMCSLPRGIACEVEMVVEILE